jgi:MFS superfamily sulfate permease-like transporter
MKNNNNIIPNLLSGFSVFLIALPLSVGIAIASGAPPSAGLLAAIVGGMVGAYLGGSELTINGPAAGLIVIVLGAVADLGQGDAMLGFKRTIAAVMIAGLFQVIFGLLKLGKYGVSVPTSVLHGMMSAIGISIVAKQTHVAFGVAPTSKEILHLLAEIPHSFANFNPEVLIVALFSAVVLLLMMQVPDKITRYLPAPLVVVIVGMGLAGFLDFEHEHMVAAHMATMNAGPKFLLNIPDHLSSLFIFPDFSVVSTGGFWKWVITIALVASLESLLSAVAVDRMDVKKRTSDLNRELISKGVCNSVLGMVGGLPIIAEIVRSTANIKNGATGKLSNFFHGFLILVFVAIAPHLLHMIPLSALAVILISVGLRLANPSQIFHLAEIGKGHALAFLVTLFVTLYDDLLVGVFCGLLVELGYALVFGKSLKSLFKVYFKKEVDDHKIDLRVTGPVVFSNWVGLSDEITKVNKTKKVTLDFSEALLVDHSTIEQIERLRSQGYTADHLEVIFHPSHEQIAHHPMSGRVKKGKKS